MIYLLIILMYIITMVDKLKRLGMGKLLKMQTY
nr:MAG TPA: hypothetical protein [Bacteriophage sp.]